MSSCYCLVIKMNLRVYLSWNLQVGEGNFSYMQFSFKSDLFWMFSVAIKSCVMCQEIKLIWIQSFIWDL